MSVRCGWGLCVNLVRRLKATQLFSCWFVRLIRQVVHLNGEGEQERKVRLFEFPWDVFFPIHRMLPS
jgi:hypothetical protein